jgi:transposase
LVNDTTRLFGMDGVAITAVLDGPDGRPLVHLATADARARICPGCALPSTSPYGWVTTRPRDLPVAGRRTELRWRKRRWRCAEQGCPRRTFTEQVPQIPARVRLTGRLRCSAGAAVCDGGRTVLQSARDHAVTWPVVNDAMKAHAARVLPERTPQVTHLGLDETRRGRPKWRFDEVTGSWERVIDRWHVGFVDLTGGQGLLGQVEGRPRRP